MLYIMDKRVFYIAPKMEECNLDPEDVLCESLTGNPGEFEEEKW